nr:hypothetical protein 5 [bacterium]BDD46702.1 hypothetical protein 13 [Paracoccaceae bacterium]BDD46752.1 hypothetical protein 5 [Paracoccaceae bacterium]
MALNSTDLFVVQSQADKKLYKLRLDSLISEIQADAGVNFRGAVDLNNPPAASGVTLPADNGDLYLVDPDAPAIDAGWVMENGETSATKGDRIIYNGETASWILISSSSSNAGTVTGVQASLPLESDGDTVTPVLSIVEARTATAATASGDGKGTDGAVHRLAEDTDVAATTGTADPRAVVTADLLKATNEIVNSLSLSPGGVTSVTTTDTNGNSALSISPTSGNVVIELSTSSDTQYGVVKLASPSDITNGTAGADAVVDASMLKDVADAIPADVIGSLTEGGTDIVTGALQISSDVDNNVTIGVNNETFAPYDFSALDDITA